MSSRDTAPAVSRRICRSSGSTQAQRDAAWPDECIYSDETLGSQLTQSDEEPFLSISLAERQITNGSVHFEGVPAFHFTPAVWPLLPLQRQKNLSQQHQLAAEDSTPMLQDIEIQTVAGV